MGKDPEPDEEKNAGLFADVLEYREAFVLLNDYGIGFNIWFDRYWHGDEIVPRYKITISKLHPEKGHMPLWTAEALDDSFLKSVQRAIQEAKLAASAYDAKLRAGPGTVATGQQGSSVSGRRALRRLLTEGPTPEEDHDTVS